MKLNGVMVVVQLQGDELLVFQQLNIQLFLQLFLREYIRYSDLDKLGECIQFNTQWRNNRWFFFLLEHIRFFELVRIQSRFFRMEHIQFLIHLWCFRVIWIRSIEFEALKRIIVEPKQPELVGKIQEHEYGRNVEDFDKLEQKSSCRVASKGKRRKC